MNKPNFASTPYAFDHGVLFAIEFSGSIRQIFVAASVFNEIENIKWTDSKRVQFVLDNAGKFVDAARWRSERDAPEGMVILEAVDV